MSILVHPQWMATTWIAASIAEESSGASATAKNAVEVLPECVQAEIGVLSAAATSCEGFGLFVLNWISPGDQP